MIDFLAIISRGYPLSKNNFPEYDKIKVGPMTMEAESFAASGLGHVSVMKGKAMFGLMKMDTLVINPFEKDMPLLSLDRIRVAGNEKLLIEMYETRLHPVTLEWGFPEIISKYAVLSDDAPESRWYDEIRLPESVHKKGKKKDGSLFDRLSCEYLEGYIGLCKNAAACDAREKAEEAKKYTDGLLSNGGPSTDVFVRQKGKEFTEMFFRKCMFGV